MPFMRMQDGQFVSANGYPDAVWVNDDGSIWQPNDNLPADDLQNFRPDLREVEAQRWWDQAPTTIKSAREHGLFGILGRYEDDADSFIKRLFESKGLNESQAV